MCFAALAGCGRNDSMQNEDHKLAIYQGQRLNPGDLIPKYTVSFHHVNVLAGLDQVGEQYCTGTIVRSQWILTAAHCLVFPGDFIKFYNGSGYSGDTRRVSLDILSNPLRRPPNVTPTNYWVNNQRQDVLLVKMDSPIPLDTGLYKSAFVTVKLDDRIDPVLGNKGWIAGGKDSTATTGNLLYADAEVTTFNRSTNGLVVDAYAETGDSGGPFFTKGATAGTLELVGVLSAVNALTRGSSLTYLGLSPGLRDWIISNYQ
jgi:hypothetical protein